jgi:hypothetical protein
LALGTVAGCGPAGRLDASPTDAIAEEHMPAYATVWLTADPPVASRHLAIALRDPDEPGWSRDLVFDPGTTVRGSFGVSSGTYRLVAEDPGCTLDLTLGPERESDVVLHVAEDGTCSLVVDREHAVGEVAHDDEGGSVDARVTAEGNDLLVRARSLDTPRNPVPQPVPPDEGRLAILDGLWPGAYVVELIRDGEVIESQTIEIEPANADGTPGGDLVEIVLDGRPD